ncbi:MAG: hypothetical protein M1812_003246 [Candelaria pacifica]|nr:MAG: hypothetical protein M1812_003246 [Candelaria pacifica]
MAFINADFKRAQQHNKNSPDYPAQYTDYYKLRDQNLLAESGEERRSSTDGVVVGGGGGGMEQGVVEEEKGGLSEDKTAQEEAKKGENFTKKNHDDRDRDGGGLRSKMKNMLRRKSKDGTGEVGKMDGGDDGVVR